MLLLFRNKVFMGSNITSYYIRGITMMLSILVWWATGLLLWVFAMLVARRMQTGGRHYEY